MPTSQEFEEAILKIDAPVLLAHQHGFVYKLQTDIEDVRYGAVGVAFQASPLSQGVVAAMVETEAAVIIPQVIAVSEDGDFMVGDG